MASKTTVQLSEQCLGNLDRIKQENGLKSMTAAIEWAANFYLQAKRPEQMLEQTNRILENLNKSINELRRNTYLEIDLLNAISIEMNVSEVFPHHEKMFRSPALVKAQNNLSVYLANIATRIKEQESSKRSALKDIADNE